MPTNFGNFGLINSVGAQKFNDEIRGVGDGEEWAQPRVVRAQEFLRDVVLSVGWGGAGGHD